MEKDLSLSSPFPSSLHLVHISIGEREQEE